MMKLQDATGWYALSLVLALSLSLTLSLVLARSLYLALALTLTLTLKRYAILYFLLVIVFGQFVILQLIQP